MRGAFNDHILWWPPDHSKPEIEGAPTTLRRGREGLQILKLPYLCNAKRFFNFLNGIGISAFELWGIGQGFSLVALKNKKLTFLRKTAKFSLFPFELMDPYSENYISYTPFLYIYLLSRCSPRRLIIPESYSSCRARASVHSICITSRCAGPLNFKKAITQVPKGIFEFSQVYSESE